MKTRKVWIGKDVLKRNVVRDGCTNCQSTKWGDTGIHAESETIEEETRHSVCSTVGRSERERATDDHRKATVDTGRGMMEKINKESRENSHRGDKGVITQS